MANTTAPRGSRFSGLFKNDVNGSVDVYDHGTKVATLDGTALTVVGAATANSLAVVTGTVSIDEVAYTFPADDGDSGEQLQTDGSGVLSWAASGV